MVQTETSICSFSRNKWEKLLHFVAVALTAASSMWLYLENIKHFNTSKKVLLEVPCCAKIQLWRHSEDVIWVYVQSTVENKKNLPSTFHALVVVCFWVFSSEINWVLLISTVFDVILAQLFSCDLLSSRYFLRQLPFRFLIKINFSVFHVWSELIQQMSYKLGFLLYFKGSRLFGAWIL